MATLKGVWVFNETLTNPNGSLTEDPLNFSSNGENFYAITARDTMQAYGLLYDSSSASGTGAGQFVGQVIYTFNGSSYTDLPPNTWAKEAYRTVDFGTTEQIVSTRFYNWLTANATQQASEDDSGNSAGGVTITYNGSVIASLAAGQTATMNCAGKKMNGDIVIAYDATHALYNGVRLPIIPADVLVEYPYCWIRNNTRTGYYDLLLSQDPWYLQDTNTIAHQTTATQWYQVAIASGVASVWGYHQEYSSLVWGNESDRRIMWSNHDIPNGSATATDIYFYGTDPVPVVETNADDNTALEITYKGKIIATLEKGQTATLNCAGKKMAGDIVITFNADMTH